MQNSPPCKANFCSASSRGKKPNTPMFLIFSGRCQKCHFSFHIITQESGFSVFHYETKTQFILRLVNLKGLAKVNDYEKQPGVYLQDMEMHQASNSLCNGTCSLALSLLKAQCVGGTAALGYCRFYPKLSAAWDTQGKRPRISLNGDRVG